MALSGLNGKADPHSPYFVNKFDSASQDTPIESNGEPSKTDKAEKAAKKNQESIQRLTERMFHVDHALHSMQEILLELGNKVKIQAEQLDRIDVLQLQIETNEMKLSAAREDAESLSSMGQQVFDLDARVRAFEELHGKVDTLHRKVVDVDAIRQVQEPPQTETMLRLENNIRELQSWRSDMQTWRIEVGDFHAHLSEDKGHVNQEHLDAHAEKHKEQLQQHHLHFTSMFDEIRERLERTETGDKGKKDPTDISNLDNFAENEEFHDAQYVLSASVWDIAILLFSPVFRRGESFIGTVLYIVNIMMQGTFLVICGFFFVSPSIDQNTVEGAKMFRNFDAHNDAWLYFGTSLAQRLCIPEFEAPDPIAMVIGGFQNAELQDFETYLKKDATSIFERFFNGEVMCLLAMGCWVASVMQEVNYCLDLGLSLVYYPIGRKTTITLSDGCLNLECLSHSRKFAGLFFLSIRFGVVCALTVFGCIWLGGTDGITDLLLNTVALGFILSIDEMLYLAMFPDRAQGSLGKFAPLKRGHWPALFGFDLKSALVSILVPCCVILSYVQCTRPLAETMLKVFDEICTGDLNFTYAQDTMTRVVLASINVDTGAAYTQNFTRMAVEAKIHGRGYGPDGNWPLSMDPTEFGLAVASAKKIPLPQLIELQNPSCDDLLVPDTSNPNDLQLRSLLMRQLHVWARSCSDVYDYCISGSFQGTLVRAVCSKTCLCDSPKSIVASHVPMFGCPEGCLQSKNYQDQLHRAGCNDMSLFELHAQNFWKAWATYIEDPITPTSVPGLGDAMLTYGCEFYNHVSSHHFDPRELRRLACRGDLPGRMRPIAVACPDTCSCHNVTEVVKSVGLCANGPQTCVGSDVSVALQR